MLTKSQIRRIVVSMEKHNEKIIANLAKLSRDDSTLANRVAEKIKDEGIYASVNFESCFDSAVNEVRDMQTQPKGGK